MPYRRLPNTDTARVRTLKTAITQAGQQRFGKPVISFKTENEAEFLLNTFEKQLILYKQSFDNQVNANKQYQTILNNVKMYISHFIQVFNLSVIRGEIKKEHKHYYKLDIKSNNVPDLTTEAAIIEWGKNIIDGENNRLINEGGTPIYNPTIAKVQVYYEVFNEYKINQKMYQNTTNRNLQEVVKMRANIDKMVVSIWNQVEAYFSEEDPENKLQRCKDFGIIYYNRRGEKSNQP